MTDDIVQQARAALDGVTEEPWEAVHHYHRTKNYHVASEVYPVAELEGDGGGGITTSATDARFIAAARTLVPQLADEVERLRAAVDIEADRDHNDPDFQAVGEALYTVEKRHHIHGDTCLCGFSSAVARERTAHIARTAFAELLGHDFVADVARALDDGEA